MSSLKTGLRSKKLWKLILINALLVVGVVLLFELFARLVGVTPESFRSHRQFGMETFPRWYFTVHEDRGFDITPDSDPKAFPFGDATIDVFSNRYGCFDHRDDVEPEYALLLGDSFTWGYGPYESKWGVLLEQQLGRRVLRCGVSDTGQKHQLSKGREIVARIGFAPKVVLVGYFENDANDDLLFPSATVIDGFLASQAVRESGRVRRYTHSELLERYDAFRAGALGKKNVTDGSGFARFKATLAESNLVGFVSAHSVTANLLWKASQGITRKAADTVGRTDGEALASEQHLDAAARKENEKAARSMASWARGIGSELVFVLIPPKELDGDRYSAFKAFLDEADIEYIDLYPHFASETEAGGERLYWEHDSHWAPGGDRLAAAVVSSHLKRGTDLFSVNPEK